MFKEKTINVTFNFPLFKVKKQELNYPAIQKEIEYIDSTGKSFTVEPKEIEGIKFVHKDEKITMLSRQFQTTSEGIGVIGLGQLAMDNRVKLFWRYYFRPDRLKLGEAQKEMDKIYRLQKGDGDIKKPSPTAFRKDMKKYFSDCPALVKKIDKREIRGSSIEDAVDFYNNKCD